MPTLSSCARCSRPAAALSPGGLCSDCLVAGETARPTPHAPTPSSAPRNPGPPRDLNAPTATHASDAGTWSVAAAPEAATRPLPPAPPGYELLKWLGDGGMGSVYSARELASERLVAMKFLHQSGNPDALDRFLLELRVLSQFDHINIVRVLSSDFMRADPYFTMELMPGGTLASTQSEKRLWPVDRAVAVARAVADALMAAHARGVIHRDVKPSNVLLAEDGTPKVSDFGLAKRLERNDQLTLASGALGTPSYMPPEQVSARNGELGPWSDVYGLGATLYHLLTGSPPFRGETTEQTIFQVLSDPPTPPRSLRPEVPPPLEGVVLKCLEKDPAARYQTAAELAADLDRFSAGQKPLAPPLTLWRRGRRWTARHRRALLSSVAGAALLTLAFVMGAASWPKPMPMPKPAEPGDPLREMRAALERKQAVTLVGATGPPRWYEWRLATAALTESPTADRSCYFQCIGLGMLDLFPAPPAAKYRVSFEIRHVGGGGPPPNQQRASDLVGIYFGADTQRSAGGEQITTLFAVLFNDSPPRPIPNVKPVPVAVKFESGLLVQRPDQLPGQFWEAGGNVRFKSEKQWPMQWPGAWRKIVIELTPDSLRVLWGEMPGGKLVSVTHWERKPVPNWTGEQTAARYAQLQNMLVKGAPNTGLTVRPWSTQLPLGVLASNSGVSFRNVVIEPLP